MSCYGWERGTITIPSNQWVAFRKGLLTQWNDRQEGFLRVAKKAHDAAKEAGKGKRGKNRADAMRTAVARVCGGTLDKWGEFRPTSTGRYSYSTETYQDVVERFEAVVSLLFKESRWSVSRATTLNLQAPKKKDLDLHPVSKSCTIHMRDASITFNNDTRSVTWDVPENNHAPEHAREHWFASEFFKALGKIEWTARSGGQIVGNDEYHRDSYDAGGGGNYVVATYSKKQQQAEREAARRERSRYGGGWYTGGRRW